MPAAGVVGVLVAVLAVPRLVLFPSEVAVDPDRNSKFKRDLKPLAKPPVSRRRPQTATGQATTIRASRS